MPGAPNPFLRSFDQRPDDDALRARDARVERWHQEAAVNLSVRLLGDPVPERSALRNREVVPAKPTKGPTKDAFLSRFG